MKPSGSRDKGRRGVKEASEALGLWWYRDPKAIRSTVGSKSAKGFPDQCGDIGVARSGLVNPWIWAVEVKNREGWSLDDILTDSSLVLEFWQQCKAACRADRWPLLWLKRAYYKPLIGLQTNHLAEYQSLWYGERKLIRPCVEVIPHRITFVSAAQFLTTEVDHWLRVWRKYNKFWSQVEKSSHCWTWTGRVGGRGNYGYTNFHGQFYLAHRVAWTLSRGPIPDGLNVCHTCDNPVCCRPTHLFLGTQRENVQDAIRKGRRNGKLRRISA